MLKESVITYCNDTILVVPQFGIGSTVVLLTEIISLGCGMSLYSKLLRPSTGSYTSTLRDSVVELCDCAGLGHGKEIFGVYWFYPGLPLGWSSFAARQQKLLVWSSN